MCCLPYRRIVSDKLSKGDIKILSKMLKSEIQSLVYLERVSGEFVPTGDIKVLEDIMRKLNLIECD